MLPRRLIRKLVVLGIVALAGAGGLHLSGATPAGNAGNAQRVDGRAEVVDGDTIRIGDRRIRLLGIDAPEAKQKCGAPEWPCGLVAAHRLQKWINESSVSCEIHDRDRYGRDVAVCHADGRDLNEAMILEGMAVATPQYSRRYVDSAAFAERSRVGIWGGPFERPDEFRRKH